jgi:hypothetical protein
MLSLFHHHCCCCYYYYYYDYVQLNLNVNENLCRKMVSSGMLRCVALGRNYVLEERSASFIKVTRIGELRTTLAVTSNQRTLRFLGKLMREFFDSEQRIILIFYS